LRRDRLYGLSLAAFAVLTLVFRPTSEPFRDPRFLGHQSRELFTHALVTFPLAVGTCLGLSRRVWSPGHGRSTEPAWLIVLTGVLAVACGLFLLVASLLAGSQEFGQSGSLGRLIFPHFAEHSLGYLFVPLLAGLLYVWPAAGRGTIADAHYGRTAPGEGPGAAPQPGRRSLVRP
jgi:hypothetical protein